MVNRRNIGADFAAFYTWLGIFILLSYVCSLVIYFGTGLWYSSHYQEPIYLNPLTPMPALTGRDESWPFFHFWRHYFWPKLASSICSTSAGGEDLSSDAQIRVIGQMEPEICPKMLKKWSKKLRPKFAATTPDCSMVKIARLADAFLEVFQLQESPVEGQSQQQIKSKRKGEKGKAKKISKVEKPKDIGHFLVQKLSQNLDFCACPSENVFWHASVSRLWDVCLIRSEDLFEKNYISGYIWHKSFIKG